MLEDSSWGDVEEVSCVANCQRPVVVVKAGMKEQCRCLLFERAPASFDEALRLWCV